MRRAAAVVAVLVLGLLAWWLLRPGPRAPAPEDPGPATPARGTVSPEETPAGGRPAPGRKPGFRQGPEDEGESLRDPDRPPVESPKAEGTCVLEDGTPLAGVTLTVGFRAMEQTFNVSDGDGGLSTDRDRAARISFATADPVSAEGADLKKDESGDGDAWTVTPTSDRFRIVFRDRPWWSHIRLVDADKNQPIVNVAGLKVTWHIPGGTMSLGFDGYQSPGGWVPLPAARLPESEGKEKGAIDVDPEKVEVEFAMPGFERARLPMNDLRGRREIRVRPVPADATGVLAVPRGIRNFEPLSQRVTASLRWTGPEPAPQTGEVLGLPSGDGPFSLYALPDGPWVLEVAATLPGNTVVRGKKAFEKRGGPVDLGTIELVLAGRVTIGVLDAAGDPIPQAWAVIVRPEEDPAQGRRLDFDDWGVVALGDLEPGVGHRVIAKGLPRELEQTIVASADNKPVEFKWPEKLVPCRITISVDGKAVANADGRTSIPAVVQESPLPRNKGKWSADGTFEAKLVPGTYRFSVLATPKEGGDLALFGGEVTVLSGDSFETKLELKREGR